MTKRQAKKVLSTTLTMAVKTTKTVPKVFNSKLRATWDKAVESKFSATKIQKRGFRGWKSLENFIND
ncbi:MAG: hypothetical protein ACOVKF_00815 [Limnohabitans sp.]